MKKYLYVVCLGILSSSLYSGWKINYASHKEETSEKIKVISFDVEWKGTWTKHVKQYLPAFRVMTILERSDVIVCEKKNDTVKKTKKPKVSFTIGCMWNHPKNGKNTAFADLSGFVCNEKSEIEHLKILDVRHLGIGVGAILMNHAKEICQFFGAKKIELIAVPLGVTDELKLASQLGLKFDAQIASILYWFSTEDLYTIYQKLGFKIKNKFTSEMIYEFEDTHKK